MPGSKQKPNLKSQAPNKIQIIKYEYLVLGSWFFGSWNLVPGIFYNWLSFLEHHEDSI